MKGSRKLQVLSKAAPVFACPMLAAAMAPGRSVVAKGLPLQATAGQEAPG